MKKSEIKQFWDSFTLILKYRIISFIPIVLTIFGVMIIVTSIHYNRIALLLMGLVIVTLGTILKEVGK